MATSNNQQKRWSVLQLGVKKLMSRPFLFLAPHANRKWMLIPCKVRKKLQVESIRRRLVRPTGWNELEDNRTNGRPTFQEFSKSDESLEPMARFRVCKDRLVSIARSIPIELPQNNLRKLAHATGYSKSFENVSWWCSSSRQHFDDDPDRDVWFAWAERSW